jgi:hypothetical protein
MLAMKKLVIYLYFMLFVVNLYAQEELAIIKDKDGYTNIRSNKGIQYSIIGKIRVNEFLLCEPYCKDWSLVTPFQWYKTGELIGNRIIGYVHRSRIQLLNELPIFFQKDIISKILTEYKTYNEEIHEILYRKEKQIFLSKEDSLKFEAFQQKDFDFIQTRLNPILYFFPTNFKSSPDRELLTLLFDAIWAGRGSANEQPSFTLAECYIQDENYFIAALRTINNIDQLNFIINDTICGTDYYFNISPDSEEYAKKQHSELIKKINDIKIQ